MMEKCPQCKMKQMKGGVCAVCGYEAGSAYEDSYEYLEAMGGKSGLFGGLIPTRILFFGLAAFAVIFIATWLATRPGEPLDPQVAKKQKQLSAMLLETQSGFSQAYFSWLRAANIIMEQTRLRGEGSSVFKPVSGAEGREIYNLNQTASQSYTKATKALDMAKPLMETMPPQAITDDIERAYTLLKETRSKVEELRSMVTAPSGSLKEFADRYKVLEDAKSSFLTDFSMVKGRLMRIRDLTVKPAQ